MLVEMRTAGIAWMSKFQTLPLLACTVQLYIFIYNHSWEGCAVSVPITGSNPSHYQKYYFPRICLFLSLFPVALEAQEKNCFTCGLVSVKESDRRGQKRLNLVSIQSKTYLACPSLLQLPWYCAGSTMSPFPSSLLLLLTPLLSQLSELCLQLRARSLYSHLNSLSC